MMRQTGCSRSPSVLPGMFKNRYAREQSGCPVKLRAEGTRHASTPDGRTGEMNSGQTESFLLDR